MLFYIFLLLSSALFIYKFKIKSYWKSRNVKEVSGLLWDFAFGDRSLSEYYKQVYDENDTVVGVYLGSQPLLILKDLEDVQAVLAGDFQSFYSRGIIMNEEDTLANNTLLLNNYKKWKIIRQKLSPLFTSSKLKNMFYIMNKCAKEFVDLLKEDQMRDVSFDMLCVYTTSSVGATVFGITSNTMDSPFIEMTRQSLHPSLKFLLRFGFGSLFPKLFKKLNIKFFEEHEEFLVGFVKRVKREREKSVNPIKRHDFIDLCIELQKQGLMEDPSTNYTLEPTDELLAAQAFSFFLAGVDTSATTLHFVLLELSSHQKMLAKVHKEIDSVFENGKEELTYNDVEKLVYLDMVISEVIRKYPPIGMIQRVCTKTTVLPSSKVTIEKGAGVVVPVFAIHRDKKYFPNPEELDPERFASENLSKIQKFSYIPFGEGNRVCIGSRFAGLQVKAALAWLLHTYTLAGQVYNPKSFDKSPFAIRDPKGKFTLISRSVK